MKLMIGGNSFLMDTVIFKCEQCYHSRVNLECLFNDGPLELHVNHKFTSNLHLQRFKALVICLFLSVFFDMFSLDCG